MMDEYNGFNLTMLNKGEGFIDFNVVLSDETKQMILFEGLNKTEFT